ncbi:MULTISPECIES: Crp/Fnr family transcriptional regulator [Methylobacterium]|uniref:Nitrogen fixation regulation protein FixK n=1 Tax=Methylobacterium jeotgali TaxID=381630 RepID=A0ABQ4SSD0_9HYPH|nr:MULTISPECIES: Crp/Fnr family transcriptional regulator [Methylobacterium]PIU06536.1 MAG: hypothetical protein COT56_09505 [Methylobacterium sp. CG09_land_8_20_14_0_10_71_15]PIU11104.1 MAG: hypothetical protein COT28_21715 [Methylobacterium sp. CG08_land_8_20_14_0_20_71_15]GJE06105.1 Nitrogen fixation regulation protein FixK [Methylobacterium jeotgali]
MTSPFVQKLRHGACLTEEDALLLDQLARPVHVAQAHHDILMEGDPPHTLTLILEGWACRYKQLDDGRRQIIALFLPGDLCEPYGILPHFMDHSLGAITAIRYARIRPDEMRALARANARIEEALWWDMLLQSAMQHEQTVSFGRRLAAERLAHFICELRLRLALVGLADETGFELPLIQSQLADAMGLTAVHINRTLMELRAAGLIELQRKQLTIRDPEALRNLAVFDPVYFHLDQRKDCNG